MRSRPPKAKDPREAAIDRLIKAIRRQHDHFINILISRDRAQAAGEHDLSGFERKLVALDHDLTANEQQLKGLGYLPRHREKVIDG